MSKAFTKERDDDEDDAPESAPAVPAGTKNYMTPAGHARLVAERDWLLREERPRMVEVVAWAASNGDRSENGDYLYGKKRLREIDRRLRFLGKRLDNAEVVDPTAQAGNDQVFFGATVEVFWVDEGREETYAIVGIDEADASRGRISWISPLARALRGSREGDTIRFASPAGLREIEITEVRYEALS
ncbi:MAG: transcription elongation factor GreB [Zoogloeaceae bacterium]|jgi:transcription elongation factor GreB|nr:transcription elongation factor GreB [Zoogloeaceae bacterium]